MHVFMNMVKNKTMTVGGVHMNIHDDWKNLKNKLGEAVEWGETLGLSEDTMSKMTLKMGNFLSSNKDPHNREEQVIKELWEAGDEDDRQALSKVFVKLARKEKQ